MQTLLPPAVTPTETVNESPTFFESDEGDTFKLAADAKVAEKAKVAQTARIIFVLFFIFVLDRPTSHHKREVVLIDHIVVIQVGSVRTGLSPIRHQKREVVFINNVIVIDIADRSGGC